MGVTPSESILSVGDPLTLTCTGSDCVGTTTFTFSWSLDGSPVEASLVTDSGTTSQLSVTSVTSADFGTYTCQVTSVYGTGTAVAYVRETGELHIQHVSGRFSWVTPLAMSHLCHWVRRSAPHTECVLVWRAVLLSVTMCGSEKKGSVKLRTGRAPSTCPSAYTICH